MAAAMDEPSAGALAEASDHWAVVAGALLADREAFVAQLTGEAPADARASSPFGSDPAVAHSLTLLCHHGLHGLLVQWAFDEASARLKEVAVSRSPDIPPPGTRAPPRAGYTALPTPHELPELPPTALQ
jgi:hypothetical protein